MTSVIMIMSSCLVEFSSVVNCVYLFWFFVKWIWQWYSYFLNTYEVALHHTLKYILAYSNKLVRILASIGELFLIIEEFKIKTRDTEEMNVRYQVPLNIMNFVDENNYHNFPRLMRKHFPKYYYYIAIHVL